MSERGKPRYRRADGDNAAEAAAVLAVQFGLWVDATGRGTSPPEPDQVRIGGSDQVADAIGRIAGHLGLETKEQRKALFDLLCGLSNMIGDQGAELEGVLHPLPHPEAGPRHAAVHSSPAACSECGGTNGRHHSGCAARVEG